MPKAHEEYRSSIAPKVNKILSEIDKLTKFSLSKDYAIGDVKHINDAVRKASNKMLKTLTNNLEEEEQFTFSKTQSPVEKASDLNNQTKS
jgi:hypothetical protein